MENLCTLKENSITQTILGENLKIKLQNKQLDLGKCERWKKQQMPNAAVQNSKMKIFMRARKKQGKNGVGSECRFCNTISLKMESFQFQWYGEDGGQCK